MKRKLSFVFVPVIVLFAALMIVACTAPTQTGETVRFEEYSGPTASAKSTPQLFEISAVTVNLREYDPKKVVISADVPICPEPAQDQLNPNLNNWQVALQHVYNNKLVTLGIVWIQGKPYVIAENKGHEVARVQLIPGTQWVKIQPIIDGEVVHPLQVVTKPCQSGGGWITWG